MPDGLTDASAAKILIAEDEAIVAEDLALTVQDLGYEVVGKASTGLLAIQMAEESTPDLILMDIKLAGEIDGIEASEQIRARFDIPVIFLTAYEEADVIFRAKMTEPYGFLAKPFSYYILKTTIETAMYKHAADKRVRESEERYRMLVEQSIDGIAVIQGSVLRFVNPALAKMFGIQKEQAEGQDFLTFVAPEYRDLMKKREVERDEGKPVPDCYEFTALRKDGSPFTAEVRVNLTTYHGETARQGIIRDISERKKLEVALRQSQQMLSLAIEGANLGIWDWDLTTGKASWSERIYRMLGYAFNEFQPDLKNWRRFVHPDDWPQVRETLSLHLKGKLPKFEVLYRAPNKSREWRWLQVQGTVTEFDSYGKPIRITGVVADITDRKKAEEALRESEERYRTLVSIAPDGIFVNAGGRFAFANDAAARIFGVKSPDELIGKCPLDMIHPDYRKVVSERMRTVLEERKPVPLYERKILRPDGTVAYTENAAAPILYRGQQAAQVVIRDITDRKKAEEALIKSEQRYRDLFQNATDAMYTHDLDGNFTSANAATEKVLGVDLDRLLTMNVQDVVHPDDLRGTLENLRIKAENGVTKTGPYEIRIVRPDATERWLEVTSRLVLENGEPSFIQGMARDVTERKLAQEALMKSEQNFRDLMERFRMLSENAPFGMVMINEAGVFEYVNARFTKIFGYDLSDVPNGREWFQKAYPDPDYRHKTIAAWKEDLKGLAPGGSRSRVFEVTCKDGNRKIIHFRPVKLSTGEDLMTCEDITDRIRAEEARREIEDRYRSLVETSPDPIILYDLEGNLITVNQQAATVYGVGSPEEVLAEIRNVSEIMDEEGQKKAALNLKRTLTTGATRKNEYTLRRKNGSSLTVEINSSIIRNADGAPTAFISVVRDMTARKEVEQKIRESEEKYRALFEDSIDAVYISTREGILVDANQAFLDLFGFSREEARNMDVSRIYSDGAERKRFQEEIERKGSLKDYEVRFLKEDGTRIEGLLTSTVRRDKDGTILGYQGIVRDVTERKQLQEQLLQAQKMEAVGTLAGGIAHDFNNLLQAILGYTDLLLMRKKAGDPDRHNLEIVHQTALDGADLVSRILAFSMKAEFRVRVTDLNQEMRRVEKLLRRMVPRMIAIDLVLADDLWVIDADPARIEQVLLNLAVNAQHAMPDGGRLLIETSNVSLRGEYVRTHLEAKPGNYVLLTVSDTGTGMAPGVVGRIFEPFFTTRANGEGTGLGLAMVHGIVSQHGGYIRCYSEPGLGTSFKIYFPVSQTEHSSDMDMTREMPAFGTETILLVDDDDRIRDVAQEMIEMGGYQVLAATSGEEALKMYAARRGEVSLVILDLIMPGMGGKRCLEELLRIDPDARVLFASGYSSNGLTLDKTGTGARGFIRKPYDSRDILTAIRKVLDRGHL